jgi:hypothetical protein
MKHDHLRVILLAEFMSDDTALEDAVLAIYRKQTEDEKRQGATTHHNKVGFSGCDARQATYCAKWLLDTNGKRNPHRHLSGRFLDWARRAMPKYAGQLATIVAAKEESYLVGERIAIQQF